jgi:hypothetical protein
LVENVPQPGSFVISRRAGILYRRQSYRSLQESQIMKN